MRLFSFQMERDTTRQAHNSLRTAFEQQREAAARAAADLAAAEKLQGRMLADLEQLQENKKVADVHVAELQTALVAAQASSQERFSYEMEVFMC